MVPGRTRSPHTGCDPHRPRRAGAGGLSLEELAEDITTLYEQSRTHADRLRSLRQALHAIDARLAELLVQHPPNARVFRWEDLPEPEREAKHAALTTWVTAIADRYRYDEIPGCPRWPQHPALVEELTALWLSWTGAYTPGAHPSEPLRWHEALHRARDRLADLRAGCTATEHHPTRDHPHRQCTCIPRTNSRPTSPQI